MKMELPELGTNYNAYQQGLKQLSCLVHVRNDAILCALWTRAGRVLQKVLESSVL